MPTQYNDAVTRSITSLETKIGSLETKIEQLRPSFKINRAWRIIIIATAVISGLLCIYTLIFVPTKYPVNLLKEQVNNFEREKTEISKIPEQQLSAMSQNINAMEQRLTQNNISMEQRLTERMQRTENNFTQLNNTFTGLILAKLVETRKKAHASYTKAISVRQEDLDKTLPVARELLSYAKSKGTLRAKDIKDLAEQTLPLLSKNYNPKVHSEVWKTVVKLTSYRTFVSRNTTKIMYCKDGIGTIGGASSIPLKDEKVMNCNLSYEAGDIKLENVRFINCEFTIAETPESKMFVEALLRSDTLTITLDTSSD